MWFTSRPVHRVLLLDILLIYSTVYAETWAPLASPYNRFTANTVRKRFGQSVVEEGLPFWLERRAVFAEPDTEWGSESIVPYLSQAGTPEELAPPRGLEKKSQQEIDNLIHLLREEKSRQYGYKADIAGFSSEDPIRVVRREDKSIPGGVGQLSGYRSHMSWQPIDSRYLITAIGVVCSVFGIMVITGAVVYYQKVQLPKKRNQENDFGGLLPAKPSPTGSLLGDATNVSLDGDRKLAHSAQMYHYQHQKQQMLAVERASDAAQGSEEGSESDVEEGDFTVYECPGLATTGQLEVENPLYEGDAATNGPSTNGSYGEIIGASDLEENSDSTPTTKAEEH
ncbi:unnamed protein product [Echinostoma caproni]|uniref:Neural proliferation differentiation and control protein 1 n=1 Tax=Echinostoma caproni TaxID=27848 RepID=A0A183A9S8_9TREM|nr:unnamed protein product [Echinostoma caproni]